MEQETKPGFLSLVSSSFRTVFELASDFIKLAQAEAALAKESLVRLIIVYAILSFLLLSTWICLLVWLVVALIALHLTWIMALSVVMGLHIIGIAILFFIIAKLKKNLKFQATRKQLSDLRSH